LSTYLPLRDFIKKNFSENNKTTPLLACHGTSDFVLQFSFGKLSAEGAKSMKGDDVVQFKEYKGLGHNSSGEEFNDILDFISKL